jgi:hypothetical protein
MDINVKKAHNQSLMPKMVNWLYISIIPQSITSALVVCWPRHQTASAKKTKQDTKNCTLSDSRGDSQHSYGYYGGATHLRSST